MVSMAADQQCSEENKGTSFKDIYHGITVYPNQTALSTEKDLAVSGAPKWC